jgi:predicted DCC family thiol-disulfide oxidoreductase YuxK
MNQKKMNVIHYPPTYDHLVLFDGNCPFCHRAVRHIIQIDRDELFLFAPLKGKTAQELLMDSYVPMIEADSLILIENFKSNHRKVWIRSRAILRIYWLIGYAWKIIGAFSFFPGCMGDLFYRLFSLHRYKFKLQMPVDSMAKDRLLP